MAKTRAEYEALLSIFAELVWDEALKKFKEERLYQAIDNALERGDEHTFYNLTNELKSLSMIS